MNKQILTYSKNRVMHARLFIWRCDESPNKRGEIKNDLLYGMIHFEKWHLWVKFTLVIFGTHAQSSGMACLQ